MLSFLLGSMTVFMIISQLGKTIFQSWKPAPSLRLETPSPSNSVERLLFLEKIVAQFGREII